MDAPSDRHISFTFEELHEGLLGLLGPEFRASGPLDGLYEPSPRETMDAALERFGWDEVVTIIPGWRTTTRPTES